MAKVGAHEITLTYLNIRQSISILVAKLFVLDLILAACVIGIYFALGRGEEFFGLPLTSAPVFLTLFSIIGIIKVFFTSYVVLEWLNEYYELTPDFISHKSGIIFRKKEIYRLDHIRAMEISEPFIGELLNFGTITLYDIRLEKELEMYLIHNPNRYASVIKQLRPHMEEKSDMTKIPFLAAKEPVS